MEWKGNELVEALSLCHGGAVISSHDCGKCDVAARYEVLTSSVLRFLCPRSNTCSHCQKIGEHHTSASVH